MKKWNLDIETLPGGSKYKGPRKGTRLPSDVTRMLDAAARRSVLEGRQSMPGDGRIDDDIGIDWGYAEALGARRQNIKRTLDEKTEGDLEEKGK